MLYEHAFQNPEGTPRLLAEIERLAERIGPVRLMEICGTHTMAIAKGGLRSLLPASVRLISGPGCPVCVTSAGDIDDNDLVFSHGRSQLPGVSNGVGALDGGNDALQS